MTARVPFIEKTPIGERILYQVQIGMLSRLSEQGKADSKTRDTITNSMWASRLLVLCNRS